MNTKLISKVHFITSLYLVVGLLLLTGGVQVAYAASLTALTDTMSSSKELTTSSHTMKFTTPTGAAESTDTIIITFPSTGATPYNFTSKTIGTVTFTHGATTGAENSETLAASPSATAWGAVFSGTQNRILTLTAPTDGVGVAAIAASDKVIITYDSTNSINPSANASPYTTTISGTFGDTGNITVAILTDDQVAVTATVDQSLTFSISDNTIGFGSLSASAACFAQGTAGCSASEVEAHNIVVGTNAGSGYSMTINGTTLTNGAFTIATTSANTASTVGSEQFGLRMTATGGVGAVSAPYAAAGYAFDSLNFPDQVAASTGASANTTYSVRYIANIASNTEAGAYTSTLTYVTTANF